MNQENISLFSTAGWIKMEGVVTLNFLSPSSSSLPTFVATFQKNEYEYASKLINTFPIFETYELLFILKVSLDVFSRSKYLERP